MKFGTGLPIQGPLTTAESLRALATRAEALGFEHLWMADHIIIPKNITSLYPYTADREAPFEPTSFYYEPLTALAYVAACTERIRLGTHVLIVPYRNPVITAKQISTLDRLSGGRVILGIGVGWMEEEFKMLGWDYYSERGAVTDEYLRLYKELWTQDDPSFEGRFYNFSDAAFHPKPIQKPHPPIWVGGHTRAAIRRTAELGDGWIPIGLRPPAILEPEEMGQKINQIREMAEKAGRSPDAIEVCFSAGVNFTDGREASSSGERSLSSWFSGTPEQIAEDFRSYEAVGVSHFNVGIGRDRQGDLNARLESMEQFAKEIMPLL